MPTGKKPKPGVLTQHIAGVLRAEVARQKISQTALAEATGISQPQVSNFLSGKKSPNVDELEALCRALGRRYLDVNAEAERHAIASMNVSDEERAGLLDAIARHTPPSHGSGHNSQTG